jgi:hypothetical protein
MPAVPTTETSRAKELAVRALFIPLLTAVAVLAGAASATGAVTNCAGTGVTADNAVYGVCNTDQGGGAGSVDFSSDGLTARLAAKTQRGAEQVAAFWQSNGPVAATTEICVTVHASQLSLRGAGSLNGYLLISYNGATQAASAHSIVDSSSVDFCWSVPPDATNIWWQLQLVAGGDKPMSQVQAAVTLDSVRVS